MKFGLVMPAFGPSAAGADARRTQLAVARRAEELGYDSLWAPDHIVLPVHSKSRYPYTKSGDLPLPVETPFLEVMTYLGFLAGVTQRVRFGSNIAVLPQRDPILMAKALATIDVLSGGRVILGAGVGYLEEEITVMGGDFANRGRQSDEYVAAMRTLWRDADPAFSGDFVRFADIKAEPKPLSGDIPIWFGGHSRPMMRRIARNGQGCIFAAYDEELFNQQVAMLEAACEEIGRDVAEIQKVAFMTSAYSVEESVRLVEVYARLGVDYFIGFLPTWGATVDDYLAGMESFAEKVGVVPVAG